MDRREETDRSSSSKGGALALPLERRWERETLPLEEEVVDVPRVRRGVRTQVVSASARAAAASSK